MMLSASLLLFGASAYTSAGKAYSNLTAEELLAQLQRPAAGERELVALVDATPGPRAQQVRRERIGAQGLRREDRGMERGGSEQHARDAAAVGSVDVPGAHVEVGIEDGEVSARLGPTRSRRDASDGLEGSVHVGVRRAEIEHRDPHRAHAAPGGGAEPGSALGPDRFDGDDWTILRHRTGRRDR